MITESYKIALVGLGALVGGVFVLVRRKSLSRANAKVMAGRFAWTRADYSEEYFLFLSTAGGIFFILIGIMALLSAIFRDPNGTVSGPVGNLIVTMAVSILLAGLVVIAYAGYAFRRKK